MSSKIMSEIKEKFYAFFYTDKLKLKVPLKIAILSKADSIWTNLWEIPSPPANDKFLADFFFVLLWNVNFFSGLKFENGH